MSNTTVTRTQPDTHPQPRPYELATDIGRANTTGPLPSGWEEFLTAAHNVCDATDTALGAVRATTADELARGVYGEGDPTPVDDLEAWHHTYDPAAAAVLDAQLDEAFGPLPGARRDDIEWRTAR